MIEAVALRELFRLEKVINKKTGTQKQFLQLLSSVGPPQQVVLKGKRRRDSAPPLREPKTPSQIATLTGTGTFKGPRYKQSEYFSRKIRTIMRDQPETQQQPYKTQTIYSGEFGLCMRGGGAHVPPRCSEVPWWGPGHRRSQRLLPSREPPHAR